MKTTEDLIAEAERLLKSVEAERKDIKKSISLLMKAAKTGPKAVPSLPGMSEALVKRRAAPAVGHLKLESPPKEVVDKTVKSLMNAAVRKVRVQEWIFRDSWSGPDLGGYSLHLSEEDRVKYINEIIRTRTGPVPECYESPEGAKFWAVVSKGEYKALLEAKKRGEFGTRPEQSGKYQGPIIRD